MATYLALGCVAHSTLRTITVTISAVPYAVSVGLNANYASVFDWLDDWCTAATAATSQTFSWSITSAHKITITCATTVDSWAPAGSVTAYIGVPTAGSSTSVTSSAVPPWLLAPVSIGPIEHLRSARGYSVGEISHAGSVVYGGTASHVTYGGTVQIGVSEQATDGSGIVHLEDSWLPIALRGMPFTIYARGDQTAWSATNRDGRIRVSIAGQMGTELDVERIGGRAIDLVVSLPVRIVTGSYS